jgi:hypothetical protein
MVIEKNIFLTRWEIYEKINRARIDYDSSNNKQDFIQYLDENTDILTTKNPEFEKALEDCADDERSFLMSL